MSTPAESASTTLTWTVGLSTTPSEYSPPLVIELATAAVIIEIAGFSTMPSSIALTVTVWGTIQLPAVNTSGPENRSRASVEVRVTVTVSPAAGASVSEVGVGADDGRAALDARSGRSAAG